MKSTERVADDAGSSSSSKSKLDELDVVRVQDGHEESENGFGIMLRKDEFEAAGWFPPELRKALRIQQGGTVIQIAHWGRDDM